jgi:hypothetical protein
MIDIPFIVVFGDYGDSDFGLLFHKRLSPLSGMTVGV